MSKGLRINEEIKAPELRIIDQEGKQLGIYTLREALRMAQELDLDLVEVAPAAKPPVCRLMDYGKYVYDRMKREREARRAQKTTDIKEIWMRPKTAEHDIQFKTKRIREFIADGDKVRVRIRFRGREAWHPDIAQELLMRIAREVADVASIEQMPTVEGQAMLMVLSPKRT